MKTHIPLIAFLTLLLLGAVVGFLIGDWALSQAEYTRPMDVIEFRIAYPFFGFAAMIIPGINVNHWLDKKINS